MVSFLREVTDDAAGWDDESAVYDDAFNDYTEAVEVPAMVERLGRLSRPVLDHGAGVGRMTAALHHGTGQPVIALDYSRASLHRLVADVEGLPVLAVHADARRLPIRSASIGAVCSAGVHPLLGADDRRLMLAEVARVLPADGRLVLSTLNYSLVFRAWRLKGNAGARQGAHLFGRDIAYHRFTPKELRAELAPHFELAAVVGVRNIPARSIGTALRKLAGARLGARLAATLERHGPRVDRWFERVPLSRLTGFMLLARAAPDAAPPVAASEVEPCRSRRRRRRSSPSDATGRPRARRTPPADPRLRRRPPRRLRAGDGRARPGRHRRERGPCPRRPGRPLSAAFAEEPRLVGPVRRRGRVPLP